MSSVDTDVYKALVNSDFTDGPTLTPERTLRKIKQLYATPEIGLMSTGKLIAEETGDNSWLITAPKGKITVLLAGPDDAAKKKVVDLYFREFFHGGLQLTPQGTYSLVSFVLTSKDSDDSRTLPRIPEELAEAADLIFVFFDPTNTIPPMDTIQTFEHLWTAYQPKFHLFLATSTSADNPGEDDVACEIVRELWRHPLFRQAGLSPSYLQLTDGVRETDRLWELLQKAIDGTVDKAVVKVEQDAKKVRDWLEGTLKRDQSTMDDQVRCRVFLTYFAIWTLYWAVQLKKKYWRNSAKRDFWGMEVLEEDSTGIGSLFFWMTAAAIQFYAGIVQLCDFFGVKWLPRRHNNFRRRIQFASHCLVWKEGILKGTLLGLGTLLLQMSAKVEPAFLQKYKLPAKDSIIANEEQVPMFDDLISSYRLKSLATGSTLNTLRVFQGIMGVPKGAVIVGSVGTDQFSGMLEKCAEDDGLQVLFQKWPRMSTGVKAVLSLQGEHEGRQTCRCTDLAAAVHFTKSHLEKPEVWTAVEKAGFYCVSEDFLAISPEAVRTLAEHAAQNGKTLVMKLSEVESPVRFETLPILPFVDILFASPPEMVAFADLHGYQTKDPPDIAKLMAASPKQNTKRGRMVVVIPAGIQAPVLVVRAQEVKCYPVEKLPFEQLACEEDDTQDAFVGGFLAQLVQGRRIDECVQCGIWAAQQVLKSPESTFAKEKKYPD